MLIVTYFGFALVLRVFALVLRVFAPVLRVCFHMCERNRLHEKREAAAIAKNARIQICARSPEKRPTSKFQLRNTQWAQINVTNEGPGGYPYSNLSTGGDSSQQGVFLGVMLICRGSMYCMSGCNVSLALVALLLLYHPFTLGELGVQTSVFV